MGAGHHVDIRDFVPLLKHSKGDFAGKPFVLQPWQDAYLDKLLNTRRPDGLRQYRTSLLALPRKNGKALALDTPVRTTAGWKTMGTVEVGDYVFHPSGKPTRVVAATAAMIGRPCYEVGFTGGETIVADQSHLWYTHARIDKPGEGMGPCGTGTPGWRVRTTKEIADTLLTGGRADRNHSVTVAEAIELPPKALPIDPYLLGVWLGDGHSGCARVTVGHGDEETIRNIEATGAVTTIASTKTAKTVTLGGRRHRTPHGKSIQAKLRALGVLDNKHIPRDYLDASIEQRRALFQGLMDSDGTAAASGQCEFCNTSRVLAEDFLELATSLGYKTRLKESEAKLYGRVIGPKYRIFFTPLLPDKIFRLSRKQARIKAPPRISPRSRTRQIAKCDPCGSVPVRCIQVEASDGMFLVGRTMIPTHNSALSAVIGLYMLLFDDIGAEVICAAGDRSQAALLHTAAKQFVESNPTLASRCKVYRNSIVVPDRNASFFCISSEAGTKHGYNPSCVLVDEYHVFPDRELVDVLETGMGARSQPLTVYITTAGTKLQGPCYADWRRAEQVRDGIIDDPSFLPCIFAADKDDDPFAEETWRKANPSYGTVIKPEYLMQKARLAKESPAQETVFRTLHLNQFCASESKFFAHGVWESNNAPLRPIEERQKCRCWLGVDLSSTTDTTAVAAIWEGTDEFGAPDGTYDVDCTLFIPEVSADKASKTDRVPYRSFAKSGCAILTEGDVVDYDVVRDHIIRLCEQNNVVGVAIDRVFNSVQLTTQLSNAGVKVVPFGQGYFSMSGPTKALQALAIKTRLRHGGNPALACHIDNLQVVTDDAENIKPTKKNSSSTNRIDGAVALIEAIGIAGADPFKEDDTPELMVF